MRARLFSLLLVIPLAASGVAGAVLHVCQSMGGVVVGNCDCETRADAAPSSHEGCEEHAAPPTHAKLQSQPCCKVELSSTARWVATQEVSSKRIADATVIFAGRAASEFAAQTRACAPTLFRERGPPNAHGPPIYIRHCSFLN